MESVPEAVRQAALRAFDMRVPDARVADLVFDPVVDDHRRRSAPKDRVLRFAAGTDGAVVTVSPSQGSLRLSIVLSPPTPAAVELRTTTDSWALSADDVGQLRVDGVSRGLFSLVIRRQGERPLQTAWVRI
jgi:hypothetical protein